MKRHLKEQRNGYRDLEKQAKRLLTANGQRAKELSAFAKLRTDWMIRAQTLTDRSAGHIAEMMMIGSNMGVIQAVQNLKHRPGAGAPARNLMERLLRFEEDNLQQLRKFL